MGMSLKRVAWVAVLMVAVACSPAPEGGKPAGAGSQSAPASAEDTLKQRVSERWVALTKRDFQQAYQYESPAYRAVYTLDDYRGGFGGQVAWKRAEVTQVAIHGERAEVMVKVDYKAALPMQGAEVVDGLTHLQENWINEGGTWYRVGK
jgi:hypothetical protein